MTRWFLCGRGRHVTPLLTLNTLITSFLGCCFVGVAVDQALNVHHGEELLDEILNAIEGQIWGKKLIL